MVNRKVNLSPRNKVDGFENAPRPDPENPKSSIKGPTIKPNQKMAQVPPKATNAPRVPGSERAQSTAADMPNPTAKQKLFGGKKGHIQYK